MGIKHMGMDKKGKITLEHRFINQSITRNLTIGMILTMVIVSTIAISINFYFASQNAMTQLEDKADELIDSMSKILDTSLWNFDEETVKGIGASYALNDLISKLKIIDSQGNTYFEIDKQIHGPLINRSSLVQHGNSPVGRVDIALTSSYYREISQQLIVSGAIIIFINLIFLIITFKFLLQFFLKKPLNYFSEIVTNYGSGNYDFQETSAPVKEFLPFIRVLNEMGNKISSQMAELKKAGSKLEGRVEKRTAELAQSNKDLKLARQLALEEKEKYQSIFENAVEGFFQSTPKGRFVNVNPAFAKMLGYASPEKLVSGISDIATQYYVNDEDRKRFKQVLQKNGSVKGFEFKARCKDGSHIWVSNSTRVIHDQNGRIVRYEGNVMDITQRRQAEEENTRLEAQYRQAQKMESIGTLAGGIAHDFNNILFPILGHTEMLLMDVPGDSPLGNSLKGIYTSALRAKELVKQILTFSRQESCELKLMKIQPIIKETLKLIRSTIPATIEIIQNIRADCGAVKADPTQIHQVVMNLATNAYHAMEKIGGKLTVSLREIQLSRQDALNPDMGPGMRPGAYACLTISDTGLGMDKALTEKIFDPFFTTKEQGKGTGMGLSVVHGIVKSMGGGIQVYSEPGKGTQFQVYLPVEKQFSEKQATPSQARIQGGTEKILLVDDEEAILTMEKQMLERLGYQVTPRTSSIEALEAFRRDPDKFDLVITDMAMPNMSGEKLAVELTGIRPDIPVLLCTGFSETMSEETAASLGIRGFLLKPVVIKDLARKIRNLLD